MTLTRQTLTMIALFGSVALLGGAFAFQYIGGLAPCQLCLWQRWPHAAAILIAVIVLATGWRGLLWLGALAALATAGIGMFHVGVEQLWWDGLATCTVNTMKGLAGSDLLNLEITVGAPAACDKIAWSMLGISMPGWNVILSLGLAVIWIKSARAPA